METKKKPETIEERWDILYQEYPEVYDVLSASQFRDGNMMRTVREVVDLDDKIVVDLGSGTGLSTFEVAKYAKFVYGIEPEESMKKLAIKKAGKMNIQNVKFLDGQSEKIPLEQDSVDMATAFTSIPSNYSDFSDIPKMIRDVTNEVRRVVKKDGCFVIVNLAPFWSGGELASVLYGKGKRPKDSVGRVLHKTLKEKFEYKDVIAHSRFGSLKKALEVYGFIFGRKAIDYLKKHNKTTIKWKFRIYYRQLN